MESTHLRGEFLKLVLLYLLFSSNYLGGMLLCHVYKNLWLRSGWSRDHGTLCPQLPGALCDTAVELL